MVCEITRTIAGKAQSEHENDSMASVVQCTIVVYVQKIHSGFWGHQNLLVAQSL